VLVIYNNFSVYSTSVYCLCKVIYITNNINNLAGRNSISTPKSISTRKHTKQKKQKNKLAAPSEGINTVLRRANLPLLQHDFAFGNLDD